MSRDEHETVLFARAALFAKCPTLAFLTAENLREIAAAEGVDFATARELMGFGSSTAQTAQMRRAGASQSPLSRRHFTKRNLIPGLTEGSCARQRYG